MQGAGKVIERIGLGALHNLTDVPFLTSDNPVAWFDPSVSDLDMQPYRLTSDGPVVLLFPVSPDVMIYGHSSMREPFARHGFAHSDTSDRDAVRQMNEKICRFAYKAIFAREEGQEDIVRKHADVSPVMRAETLAVGKSELLMFQYVFAKRDRKPKWKG
jgi:hypothetical protein